MRNKIWMITRSSSLDPVERLLYSGASARRWARTFLRSERRDVLLRAGARGLRDGVLRGPRPSAEVLDGAGAETRSVAAVDARAAEAR